MRRTTRTLAILLLLCLGVLGYKRGRSPHPRVKVPTTRYHGYEINRESISRTKEITVLISSEGFGGVARGTGVLIDSTHVLTCAHMLEGPKDDIWIFPYPGDVVLKGKSVFVNQSEDLAVLELDKSVNLSHYAIFQTAHYDGEPITIIGNTMGSMKWFVTFGIVSGEWQDYILTDGVLYRGNSGGPWINERGEIVALTDFTFLHKGVESEIHGGVAAKTIQAFLTAWKAPSMKQILQMLLGGNQ